LEKEAAAGATRQRFASGHFVSLLVHSFSAPFFRRMTSN
jgi:hypothetical protein